MANSKKQPTELSNSQNKKKPTLVLSAGIQANLSDLTGLGERQLQKDDPKPPESD